MSAIKRSTATIAGLYCTFVTLIIVIIFNFSVPATGLPANVGYGAALIVLSILSLIVGITAQHPDETLLRSFQLCLAAMWGSIGIWHVTEGTRPQGVNDSEALWAGYGVFLLISLLFVMGSLIHKTKFTAVLALGFALACVFEIASLWRPLRGAAAAYYILLSALAFYSVCGMMLTRFKTRNNPDGKEMLTTHGQNVSKDYLPLGHAMNTLAFAVYAGSITGVYTAPNREFSWVICAGIFQTIAGVVAVRRGDAYNGFFFFLYGMFWTANSYNLVFEYISGTYLPPLISVGVIYAVMFFIISIISLTKELYQFLQNISFCVMCIAFCVDGNRGVFLGSMGWICFIFSLYGLAAHISRARNTKYKIPLGTRIIESATLKKFFTEKCVCCAVCLYGKLKKSKASSTLFSRNFMLGQSKYLDLNAVGFALNAVSGLAILWLPNGFLVMPWVIGFGGLPQIIVASISFSRGLTFESIAFFTMGSLWLIWGPARALGALTIDNNVAAAVGAIAFFIVGFLLLTLSTLINKAWVMLMLAFDLVVLALLLRMLAIPGTQVFEVVIMIIFVVICFYCFAASALKVVLGRDVLPVGKPLLQVSKIHSQGDEAVWADSKRQSGVKTISDIINNGGICGIPTDVVYVLVAAVKFPKSVERAYDTKKEADDRPMSMWISRREQLEAGRELFGELLWDFMDEIWPGTVSLVLPKGPWMDSLGIGSAEKYIGRPDSIAVRMPDNTVTSALIDMTGPVAVTSANPTGEADTTHHLQVLAKLGLQNCDGILCSGPAPENSASTVVDCRNAQSGKLGFFRIGIVKRTYVESVFQRVLQKHRSKTTGLPPAISTESISDNDSGVGAGDATEGVDTDNNETTRSISDDSGSHHYEKDHNGVGHVNQAFEGDDVTDNRGHDNPNYESVFLRIPNKIDDSGDSAMVDVSLDSHERNVDVDEGTENGSVWSENPYELMTDFPPGAVQARSPSNTGGNNTWTLSTPDAQVKINPIYVENETKDEGNTTWIKL